MTTGPNRHGQDWKPQPHHRGELPLDISIALVTTSNEQSVDLSGGAAPSLPASRSGAAAAVRGSSLASAILEHCRKVLPVRVTFIRLMRHNVPIESVVEQCCVTHKTVFEWRHRVLATVTGYQGRIVLRDTAWVNETYIIDTDLSRGYRQARKRGLSRQKLCICVAIDIHKNPVAVVCGHGKPSSARVRKAMGSWMSPGSLPLRDLERAYNTLVRGRRARERVTRDRCERPGLPEADGDSERPVILTQAQPLALYGDVVRHLQTYFGWYVWRCRVN